LQTEGKQQFRVNRQVCIVIGVCLIALALPLAGVILTLQELARSGEPQSSRDAGSGVSEALQGTLEGIADRKLAPEELVDGNVEIELTADEVSGERARVEGVLKSFGGIAIPTLESQAEVRLLVSVPAEHLEEFIAACSGKDSPPVRDPSGGLVEVVIKKAHSE
jgi:hypothetical protein